MEQILPIIGAQTISYDKPNQMRHVKYFGSADGIRAHMMKLADLIGPKFELVQATLDRDRPPPASPTGHIRSAATSSACIPCPAPPAVPMPPCQGRRGDADHRRRNLSLRL